MNNEKVMYSQSRHPGWKCSNFPTTSEHMCYRYHGSHDSYIFILNQPITKNLTKMLDFAWGSNGIENIIMWIFRFHLKHTVLNPCFTLKIYHVHCTDIRPPKRGRFNSDDRTVRVYPSSNLYSEEEVAKRWNWFSLLQSSFNFYFIVCAKVNSHIRFIVSMYHIKLKDIYISFMYYKRICTIYCLHQQSSCFMVT